MNLRFSNEHLIALQMADEEVLIEDEDAWLLCEGSWTNAISDDEAEALDLDCMSGADDAVDLSESAADANCDFVSVVLNPLTDIPFHVEFSLGFDAYIWNKHYASKANYLNQWYKKVLILKKLHCL